MITKPPQLRPDTQLFIYYIEGILPPYQSFTAPGFVGNWVEDTFSFLFFTRPSKPRVSQLLKDYDGLTLLDEYTMSYAQWQGGAIEPVRIGRFLLNPPWIQASPSEHEISITLDSGVVFGNGSHPTTSSCLEAIGIACSGKKVRTMLDLGTGTGVLALAAARLGCEKILAVDFNYLATLTARNNVILNDLKQNIVVVNGRAEQHISTATDLLVANIHYDVMKELVVSTGFLQQKWFVLSGLLTSQAEKILDILRKQPVLILKKWSEDQIWHTVLGITRGE